MDHTTKQTEMWTGKFGSEYTDRNPKLLKELNYVTNC